jgi:hypothetical protein
MSKQKEEKQLNNKNSSLENNSKEDINKQENKPKANVNKQDNKPKASENIKEHNKKENKPNANEDKQEKKDVQTEKNDAQPNKKADNKLTKKAKKAKKKERDFTPHHIKELIENLDKKDASVFRNISTKRLAKKSARDIIKKRIISLSLILIMLTIVVLYFVSYTYVNSGYSINIITTPSDKSISLSRTSEFEVLSVGLRATAINGMDNITYEQLTPDLDDNPGGSHNGENFIRYTFFVVNTGNEQLEYNSALRIKRTTKNVETAIRVKKFTNGVPTIYTHTTEQIDEDIQQQYGVTVEEFYSPDVIASNTLALDVNTYTKYTIVIWLEGEDQDCIDDKLASQLQLSWHFNVLN